MTEATEPVNGSDFDAFKHAAVTAGRGEIELIQAIYQQLNAGLDGIDVDLLQPDLFTLTAAKAAAARQTEIAISRASEWVDLAIHDGPATEVRSREYAAAVTRAWEEESAAAAAPFEASTKSSIIDTDAARIELDGLGAQRRRLEQERHAGPGTRRSHQIGIELSRLAGEEEIIKLRIASSERTADSVESMRELHAFEAAVSQATNWLWRDTAHVLLDADQQRHRSTARYRWLYGALLAGYAALIVALGVVLDAVLALTPIAGIVTSLVAAFLLAIADRRLIAPRLERWQRGRSVRLLRYELSECAITLANIRLIQVGIDAMASYAGVRKVPLLNPALLARVSAAAG